MTNAMGVAESWPAWLAVGLGALVGLNQLVTESEKFANALGRAGRAWHARARRRYRVDVAEFNAALTERLEEERQRWRDEEARALVAVQGRLKYVTELVTTQQTEMTELEFQIRCFSSYAEYEADWHHRLRMLIIKADLNGRHINIDQLPDHIPFTDFEHECRVKGMNWRTWIGER